MKIWLSNWVQSYWEKPLFSEWLPVRNRRVLPLLRSNCSFLDFLAILSYEYVRSSRKESQIEAERKQEFERIQNELKELYYAQAKQESQIRELVRVLKVNIPSFNYKDPLIYNTDNVPEHYKLEVQEEEGPTIYATMNNWLWSAVEYIIPSAKDSGKGDIQDRPIVLVVRDEKPQLANKMTPASSTTVPVSSTPSEKGKV